jgi:nitrogen fixation-related uncharacterized protein
MDFALDMVRALAWPVAIVLVAVIVTVWWRVPSYEPYRADDQERGA